MLERDENASVNRKEAKDANGFSRPRGDDLEFLIVARQVVYVHASERHEHEGKTRLARTPYLRLCARHFALKGLDSRLFGGAVTIDNFKMHAALC